MAEPKPDRWAMTHLRWQALSRWDNEGGAGPARPTQGRDESAPQEATSDIAEPAAGDAAKPGPRHHDH